MRAMEGIFQNLSSKRIYLIIYCTSLPIETHPYHLPLRDEIKTISRLKLHFLLCRDRDAVHFAAANTRAEFIHYQY